MAPALSTLTVAALPAAALTARPRPSNTALIVTREDSPRQERSRPPPRPSDLVARLGDRPIILVGMMGAGKSSIGKRLAVRLGVEFKDADTEIEQAANATIEEIFEQYGEEFFRSGERRVIQRLLSDGPAVVATGGGAFSDPDTRKAICDTGVAIWLKADLEVLLARVKRRSNRPLLKGPDPEGTMRRLVEERYPDYEQAPIHIHSREVSHDVVIEEILVALDDYLERPAGDAGTNS